MWPLPVGDLLFVGRAAHRTLGQYGVETIGQLAACKPEMLEQLMGKMGVQLYRYANGLDDAPVRPQHQREPVKSVGNSSTFPENLTRWEDAAPRRLVHRAVVRRAPRLPEQACPAPCRHPAAAWPWR